MNTTRADAGFTLLEILIASAIFAFSVTVLIQSSSLSLRNAFESEDMFKALQLAQSKMIDMELKYQGQLDKDGSVKDALKEEDAGVFEAPNDNFKWAVKFTESTVKLSSGDVRNLLSSFGVEKEEIDAQLEQQKLLLTNINKVIKENYAELALSVTWEKYGRVYTLPLVTHIIPNNPKVELTTNAEDEEGGASSATPAAAAGAPSAPPPATPN